MSSQSRVDTTRLPPLRVSCSFPPSPYDSAHVWPDLVRFNLLDKIISLDDVKIVAVKHVSLAEEYLADHFPTFPVLPGVMMIEAMTQAAGWLLHRRRDFEKSMAVLKEVRNVKYGRFVAPGEELRVEVEFAKDTETGATFKASGFVEETTAVVARLELAYFNLGEKNAELATLDDRLKEHTKQRFDLLRHGSAAVAV